MKIINQTQNRVLAEHAVLADSILSRLAGLLGHDSLLPGEGMIITQCRSIHMFFMKFSIDVIFIDRNKSVVGLVRRIKPFRMSPYFWRSVAAIELPEGTIESTYTKLGDQIVWD